MLSRDRPLLCSWQIALWFISGSCKLTATASCSGSCKLTGTVLCKTGLCRHYCNNWHSVCKASRDKPLVLRMSDHPSAHDYTVQSSWSFSAILQQRHDAKRWFLQAQATTAATDSWNDSQSPAEMPCITAVHICNSVNASL